MAKSKGTAADLPPAVQEVLGDVEPVQEAPEVQTVSGSAEQPVQTTLVEIPLGPIESRFPSPRIDLRLSGEPVFQMHCILTGLKAAKQRLRNDMPIRSTGDAIRWLLEQVKLPEDTQRQVTAMINAASVPTL